MNSGHSADFRQMIVLVAVLYSIVVLACAIYLPRKWGLISIVALSLGLAAGIIWWR